MTRASTMSWSRGSTVSALLLLTSLALLGLGRPAAAHAVLQETVPADGASLDSPPDEVVLRFNEPVGAGLGAIRVYDTTGEQVDAGDASNAVDDATVLRVGMPDDLARGTYVATWTATSADSHPIRGAFVFDVGGGAGADDEVVAAIFAQATDSDVGSGVAAAVGRWLVYAGALLAVGGLVFLLAVHDRREDDRRLLTRPVQGGALVGLVATVVGVGIQGALLTGLGPAAMVDPTVLGEVLGSSYGLSAGVRLLGLVVLLVAVPRLWRPAAATVSGVGAATVLGSFALTGHTASTEPRWLVTLADVAHTAAGAAWFGGLVLLLLALRRRRLEDDPVAGARLVARYSSLATGAIALVAVAGTALSVLQVRAPSALVSTTYGWTLIAKLVVVGLVVAAGAYNHNRLVPLIAGTRTRTRRRARVRVTASAPQPVAVASAVGNPGAGAVATLPRPDDPAGVDEAPPADSIAGSGGTAPPPSTPAPPPAASEAWGRLARTVRLEVIGIVVVLAITAVLVTIVPARTEAGLTGVFSEYAPMGDEYQVNLTVDPNQAGENELHLYLLSATGQPVDIDGDLTMAFSLPENQIAAIERTPTIAGPGHWTMDGNELSIPGTWTVEVVARVSDFEQLTAEVEVPVQP